MPDSTRPLPFLTHHPIDHGHKAALLHHPGALGVRPPARRLAVRCGDGPRLSHSGKVRNTGPGGGCPRVAYVSISATAACPAAAAPYMPRNYPPGPSHASPLALLHSNGGLSCLALGAHRDGPLVLVASVWEACSSRYCVLRTYLPGPSRPPHFHRCIPTAQATYGDSKQPTPASSQPPQLK